MKFIGQYIQSFIARFRSDVYLEDIDAGTIASGGNLGLDSNNKIVKGTAPLGTLTTLTVDEITIDGDTITASDDLNIVATGNDITVDADNFTIESATSVKPTFTLKATVNSNKPANLAFVKDKGAAGANGDFIGDTYYVSDNDAQEQIIMATVQGKVSDATDGAEEGEYIINVKNTSSAAPRPSLTLTGTGAAVNATIGYGVSSRINIAGVLTMNGTSTINNAGVIQVAAQTVIDHDQLANFAANEHYTQANITTVGTIGTGVWNGDVIGTAYTEAKVTSVVAGDGINVSGATGDVTVTAETATDSNPGIVELATDGETTLATDSTKAVTPASLGVALTVHGFAAQTGKNYRIINCSFRGDIGTTKHYLPLKSQDEQTALTREEGTELAVCDGRLVSATVRVESITTSSDDFNLTIGVETNDVGDAYATFDGTSETETLVVNTSDDHHLFHFVFDTAKHWDSTDMFAISIQSSEDHWGSNERFFVTLVIEDDWSTYLAGASREIDTTP